MLGHQLARVPAARPGCRRQDAMSGLDVADGLPTGGQQVTLVCPLLAESGQSVAPPRTTKRRETFRSVSGEPMTIWEGLGKWTGAGSRNRTADLLITNYKNTVFKGFDTFLISFKPLLFKGVSSYNPSQCP